MINRALGLALALLVSVAFVAGAATLTHAPDFESWPKKVTGEQAGFDTDILGDDIPVEVWYNKARADSVSQIVYVIWHDSEQPLILWIEILNVDVDNNKITFKPNSCIKLM